MSGETSEKRCSTCGHSISIQDVHIDVPTEPLPPRRRAYWKGVRIDVPAEPLPPSGSACGKGVHIDVPTKPLPPRGRACWNCTYHQNTKVPHTCLLQGKESSDVACCDAWTGRRLFQIDEDMKAGLWHDWSQR